MIQELDLKQGEGRQASRARARRHLRHIWSGTISPTIEHMRGEREREREREPEKGISEGDVNTDGDRYGGIGYGGEVPIQMSVSDASSFTVSRILSLSASKV